VEVINRNGLIDDEPMEIKRKKWGTNMMIRSSKREGKIFETFKYICN
jgi:hypothetical protein